MLSNVLKEKRKMEREVMSLTKKSSPRKEDPKITDSIQQTLNLMNVIRRGSTISP